MAAQAAAILLPLRAELLALTQLQGFITVTCSTLSFSLALKAEISSLKSFASILTSFNREHFKLVLMLRN